MKRRLSPSRIMSDATPLLIGPISAASSTLNSPLPSSQEHLELPRINTQFNRQLGVSHDSQLDSATSPVSASSPSIHPLIVMGSGDIEESIDKAPSDRIKKPNYRYLLMFWVSVVVWAVFGVCLFEAQPTIVSVGDGTGSQFSSLAAMSLLENITAHPHPWSSEYNIAVGKFIFERCLALQSLAQANGFDVEVQTQDFQFLGSANQSLLQNTGPVTMFGTNYRKEAYSSTVEPRNILLRFRSDPQKTRPSLLVGAHFDSAVTSHGAFDDGIGVTSMLEIIRSFIHNADFKRTLFDSGFDLIFLFGNGEESGLLDARVFKYHPWFANVTAFINLEAGGNGDREMLFRSLDPRLSGVYASYAAHPLLNTLMANLFETGIVPSDTDYRVYAMENGLPGLDMAFYENRYSYHTPRDSFDQITPYPIQHMGDNIYSVIMGIYKSGYLSQLGSARSFGKFSLHFDFLSRFAISFSLVGYAIWSVLMIASAVFIIGRELFRASSLRRQTLWLDVKVLLLSIVLSLLDATLAGYVVQLFNPSFVATYPGITFTFCTLRMWVVFYVVRWFISGKYRCGSAEQAFSSDITTLLFFTPFALIAFILGAVGYAGLYIILVWLTFLVLAWFVPRRFDPLKLWIKGFFPFLLQVEICHIFIRGLAPIVLDGVPPLLVYLLFAISGLLFVIPFLDTYPKIPKSPLAIKIAVVIILAIYIMTLFLFPYTASRSERLYINFKQELSDPRSIVTLNVQGPVDLEYTLSKIDQSVFPFSNLSCSQSANLQFRNPLNSVAYCSLNALNASLFDKAPISAEGLLQPQYSISYLDAQTLGISGSVQLLNSSYECHLQFYTPSYVLSSYSIMDGMDSPLVNTVPGRSFYMKTLRRKANLPWQSNFRVQLSLASSAQSLNGQIGVEVRCMLDDWVQNVQLMNNFISALPDWMTVFTGGQQSSIVSRQFQIPIPPTPPS